MRNITHYYISDGVGMLYSLNYTKSKKHERRLFYAEDDAEAMEMVRTYAENAHITDLHIWIEEHPRGFVIEGKLFPRVIPAQEEKGGLQNTQNH